MANTVVGVMELDPDRHPSPAYPARCQITHCKDAATHRVMPTNATGAILPLHEHGVNVCTLHVFGGIQIVTVHQNGRRVAK